METPIDAPDGEGDGLVLVAPAPALSAITREDARILAELARAVEDDLARPDLAPSTERAYAHDWADFATFCRRHALDALPAAPQTVALYLKSLETRRVGRRRAYASEPKGSPSRRCAGASPRSRANTRPKSLSRRRTIR